MQLTIEIHFNVLINKILKFVKYRLNLGLKSLGIAGILFWKLALTNLQNKKNLSFKYYDFYL